MTTSAPRAVPAQSPTAAQQTRGRPAAARAAAQNLTFELHKCVRNRWQLDAVFDDRTIALEAAKAFLGRTREQAAVRVVEVEARASEAVERVIYHGTTDKRGLAAAASKAGGSASPPAIRRRPAAARGRWALLTGSPRVFLLVALLAVAVTFAIINYHNSRTHPWAFDLPDAQKAHSVRSPWSE